MKKVAGGKPRQGKSWGDEDEEENEQEVSPMGGHVMTG